MVLQLGRALGVALDCLMVSSSILKRLRMRSVKLCRGMMHMRFWSNDVCAHSQSI